MQNLLQMKRQELSGFDRVFQPLLGAYLKPPAMQVVL
jgi:hypothetical protein